MITDNYCKEHEQKQVDELMRLMETSKPHYNHVEIMENGKIKISCDGYFPQTFRSVDNAVWFLKKHQKDGSQSRMRLSQGRQGWSRQRN